MNVRAARSGGQDVRDPWEELSVKKLQPNEYRARLKLLTTRRRAVYIQFNQGVSPGGPSTKLFHFG
jgi:hypothetical protein